jgi:small basic protein
MNENIKLKGHVPKTTLFRVILITGLVTETISVVAGMSLTDTLPSALQDYVSQDLFSAEDVSIGKSIFMIFSVVAIFLLPILIVGLWKFKKWARTLYVVINLASFLFYPVIGPVVLNVWEAMFGDVAMLLEGILIGMMFAGEISHKFEQSIASS